jgi:hypothetical protein
MNIWCICWFFTHILLGILIFKGLAARRLYKSFGVKGLITAIYNYELNDYIYVVHSVVFLKLLKRCRQSNTTHQLFVKHTKTATCFAFMN